MRKLLRYVLVVSAPLCTLLPAPAAHALPATASTVVVARDFNSCGYQPRSALRLRSGPSTKHTTLGMLYPSDAISADGEQGAWYRVSLQDRSTSGLKSGTTGWVAKSGLKPQVCMQLD